MTNSRNAPGASPLHVVVIGPAGRGGIHRMMESLRDGIASAARSNIAVDFVASHTGVIALAPLAVARALAILTARRPNVVHLNLSVRGSTYRKIVIARACRVLGIPYVVHLHGSNFHAFRDQSSPSIRRAIASLFINAATIIVLGEAWRGRVAAWVPEAASRIVVLPNAVADPGPRTGEHGTVPHILFAGRLGARKGVPELVAALGSLRSEPAWRATIAGDGDVELTRMAMQAAGMAERVSVPGWIDASGMEALMREADILTLPSYDENLPMSVVEAFAHEVAVVCTPVGAVTDIVVDGVTGLLVQPGDAAGLADALRRLLDDAGLRHRIASAGRGVFEDRLNIAAYTAHMVEIWQKAAARKNNA